MTDLMLGGNKARKMDYFLQDIQDKNVDCLITYGADQSNHCRVVAAAAARLDIKCILILADGARDNLIYNGNYFMYDLLDAEIVWTNVDSVKETIDKTVHDESNKGYNPYFIQGGGHGNFGTQAYVEAFDEIIDQSPTASFDYIFFPSGTGTTQSGLVIGNNLRGYDAEIIGISVARQEERGKEVMNKSIQDYIDEHNLDFQTCPEDINFIVDYIGNGYGDWYPEIKSTIKEVAKKHSILLDPVYTGKAFYGMTDYLAKNNIKNKNVLFIHTGGTPLAFHYSYLFEDGS